MGCSHHCVRRVSLGCCAVSVRWELSDAFVSSALWALSAASVSSDFWALAAWWASPAS